MQYTFGSITLDTDRKELRRNDSIESVEPQVFDLLVLLLENRDRVVSKDEIFEIIWEGRFVSDVTLSSRISALRRALGDDGKRQDIIKTVQRRGFRFLANLLSSSIKTLAHNKPGWLRWAIGRSICGTRMLERSSVSVQRVSEVTPDYARESVPQAKWTQVICTFHLHDLCFWDVRSDFRDYTLGLLAGVFTDYERHRRAV